MNLAVFTNHYSVETLEQLRSFLGYRHEEKYGAFTLSEVRNGWPVLLLFINQSNAFMMYIRNESDTGFLSLGLERNTNELRDFVINNYQLDQYSLGNVVQVSSAIAAFEEFFKTREIPKAIDWLELC